MSKTIKTLITTIGVFIFLALFTAKPAEAYSVKSGDTLSNLSQARGGDFNTVARCAGISNPNLIFVNQYIPDNCLRSSGVVTANVRVSNPVNVSRPTVYGNAYGAGWCTWHVKNNRPDIGNYWGDAYMWLSSARNAGYSTGYQPRVGAIAWNGINQYSPLGHVSIVTGIFGNNVTVSEMAAPQKFVISYRTVPASSFIYIY